MNTCIFDCRTAVRAKVHVATRSRYPELESTNEAHSIGNSVRRMYPECNKRFAPWVELLNIEYGTIDIARRVQYLSSHGSSVNS